MSASGEVRRLKFGPEEGEKPTGFLVQFAATCPGNAEEVLRRCQEALESVLSSPVDPWPTVNEWRVTLPGWFVSQCGPERTEAESDLFEAHLRALPWEERVKALKSTPFSVGSWIQWLEPDERYWFWWDASVPNPDTLMVDLEVSDTPFPSEAFRWLLHCAGATDVEEYD